MVDAEFNDDPEGDRLSLSTTMRKTSEVLGLFGKNSSNFSQFWISVELVIPTLYLIGDLKATDRH